MRFDGIRYRSDADEVEFHRRIRELIMEFRGLGYGWAEISSMIRASTLRVWRNLFLGVPFEGR
jgi:hypothetical protein